MLLLVAGDFFRRRRATRPTDDVPVEPFLYFLAFWALLGLGTFAIAAAGFICFAVASLGVAGTWPMALTIVGLATAGVIAVSSAFVFWWRLHPSADKRLRRRDPGHTNA